ncbi:MAG: hypothetical protein CMO01_20245 [Thalassobius sp.]|nr:hypothetical protein [Thalassovita sp.]
MSIKFKILFCVILLHSTIVLAQDYIVEADVLRVRINPSITSKVVGKLNKGDHIKVIEKVENWNKITFNNKYGYVSNDFITKISKPEPTITKGFKSGFKIGFKSMLYIGIFLTFVISHIKTRDRRFKSGYREHFSLSTFLIGGIISLAIALIVGLIKGIYDYFLY